MFTTLYRTPADDTGFWAPPPAAPGGPENMFDGTIYNRGAMTLQALREKIGDRTFFRIMRDWAAQHRYGNATTRQFIALAQRDSGQNLRHAVRAAWVALSSTRRAPEELARAA